MSEQRGDLVEAIRQFVRSGTDAGPISNERALQLELGCFFRSTGVVVEFEVRVEVGIHDAHTRRQKRYLDLVVGDRNKIGIELKAPFSGRVPETMYDFCADIAFLEQAVDSGGLSSGLSIMLTNDANFWRGRSQSGIYAPFRNSAPIAGVIGKPTGSSSEKIELSGSYSVEWFELAKNNRLCRDAKCAFIEVPALASTVKMFA